MYGRLVLVQDRGSERQIVGKRVIVTNMELRVVCGVKHCKVPLIYSTTIPSTDLDPGYFE